MTWVVKFSNSSERTVTYQILSPYSRYSDHFIRDLGCGESKLRYIFSNIMRFKIENPKPTWRIPAGQKMGNCSDRQTVASCLIFSMSSILLPKSPTILWIGDLGKNLWFQTRFHEFSPQGGARQTRDSIIFSRGLMVPSCSWIIPSSILWSYIWTAKQLPIA